MHDSLRGRNGVRAPFASGEVTYKDSLLPLLQAMSQGHATYVHIHEVAEKLAHALESQVKRGAEEPTDEAESSEGYDKKSDKKNDKDNRNDKDDYLSPQQRHAQDK